MNSQQPGRIELVVPTVRLAGSWREARDEWPAEVVREGTPLRPLTDLSTDEGFAAWVHALRAQADELRRPAEGMVHATHWWIADGGRYLGAIDLRHYLNGFLLHAGGQIGYSIRPSARGQGLATWALGEVVKRAGERGLERVLLTCDESNVASRKVIERNGGVLEDVRQTSIGLKRRYWITC